MNPWENDGMGFDPAERRAEEPRSPSDAGDTAWRVFLALLKVILIVAGLGAAGIALFIGFVMFTCSR